MTALTGEAPGGARAASRRPGAGGGRSGAARGVLLLAAGFAAAFFLYTRHADMPFYYHSDEPSKVQQVTGERPLNFKHPLLLMNTTRALAKLTGADRERQAAVRAGRTASAAFAAGAVAALAAFAWLEAGLLSALCVAVVVGLCHGLFTFAHFMKEDTAVVFGFACVLLAASAFSRRPRAASAAALGAASALAISGKYAGVLVLALALPLVVLRLRRRPSPALGRGLAAFAAGCLAVLALVNVSALLDFASFRAGLAYETDHVATGGGRPFDGILSPSYLLGLSSQLVWPVRLLALGYLGWALATWRRRSFGERALALAPLAYLAALQASPIKAIRYLLPVVVLAHVQAGYAVAALAGRLAGAAPLRRAAATALLLALVAVPQAREVRRHLLEFAGESRVALYEWVAAQVPVDSVILQDRYAGLPDPSEGYSTPEQPYLPHVVITRHYAADAGDLDELLRRGVDYVAVCERIYERFAEEVRFGSDEVRERFLRRRARYEELFDRGTLVFEAGASDIAGAPVNPIVRLYRIAPQEPRR